MEAASIEADYLSLAVRIYDILLEEISWEAWDLLILRKMGDRERWDWERWKLCQGESSYRKQLPPAILFIYFDKFIYLFIYFWLCSVFIAAHRLSLVAARGTTLCCSAWASHWGGFSCCGAWALGVRASVVVAHGLSCSTACGILPDQALNLCPLHWQSDS